MVIDNIIEVGLRGNIRIPYYREKGYDIPTKIGSKKVEVIDYSKKIYVKLEDMPEYSESKVSIKCDYQEDGCRDVYQKSVMDYLKNNVNSVVKKDCCSNKKCLSKKIAECNLINFGFDYHTNQPEHQAKVEETNMRKYGSRTIMGTDYFKIKTKETVNDKYGVDNISQLEEVKFKKAETFFKNGTVATSRQQRYLHVLVGGILNYANKTPSLDIAFPEEKIYIEYDGSGHDLNLKMGQITIEEFKDKEKRKYYYMKQLGWKGVTIISRIDRMPEDSVIVEMISFAREHFNQNHSWIHFDVDNSKIISSAGEQSYSFGKLKSYMKFRKEYATKFEEVS